MKTLISPLRMAERWAQDPNAPKPWKVEGLAFRPFESALQPANKPHPFSVEASWEGN